MTEDFGETNAPDEYNFDDPGEKKSNKTLIIVAVALIVLCCCCAIVGGGLWMLWQNGDAWFDLASQLPLLL